MVYFARKIPLLLLVVTMLASCASKKNIVYFQDAERLAGQEIQQNFEPVIEVNDILFISISSMNEEVLVPFNRNSPQQETNTNNNPGLQGYLVNANGTITFPVLGAIPAEGKTRRELQNDIRTKLLEYITDVVVDVRIMNFKVTVLGEVNKPGVYTIGDERVTLPEALGLAGDLTEDGKREAITIIREEEGKQQVTKIDITTTEFFASPFYYLKQNDVVYVEPSNKGVKKSGFIPDVPALLSVVTVVLSVTILLTR